MHYRLSELSRIFHFDFKGENVIISHLGLCNRQNLKPGTLSYVTGADYFDIALENSKLNALIVPANIYQENQGKIKALILSDYPEDTFYEIFNFISQNESTQLKKPVIGQNCNIHPTAIIENDTIIGDNVEVGAFTIIHSNTVIGNNTIISSHCAIGSNGFQALRNHEGKAYNVNHMGGVKIGNNCYIADFVNIARALFDTEVIIGDNVLVDVGSHIAHDCSIGNNSVLTANTRLFGSSSVGENVWMSPGSMVMNRIHIADDCHIAPGAFVINNTIPGETYMGNPAMKQSSYIKRESKIKKLLNK